MPILNERIGAHFVLLYEDGEDLDVDEANVFLSQHDDGMGFNFIGSLQLSSLWELLQFHDY